MKKPAALSFVVTAEIASEMELSSGHGAVIRCGNSTTGGGGAHLSNFSRGHLGIDL